MSFLRADLAQLAAYQSPHPADKSASLSPTAEPLDIDPLDTNESPIDLPAALKATLAEKYQYVIAANRYPDGSHSALKQAVLSYVTASNSSLDTLTPSHITLGNGSDELIRSVLMATCLGNNGSILVATPTFSMYSILARTLGITVHSIERQDSFEIDIPAAQATIDRFAAQPTAAQSTAAQPTTAPTNASTQTAPVRVIFMVHPNSPTGNVLTQQELAWLRQLPEDILVVVDEAYFEFSGHTTLVEALSRPNWIILRTLSKAFRLAAHRVGYGIAHPNIIAALEKLRLPYNLPSFSQAAAMAALLHSDRLLEQIPVLIGERQRLLSALTSHPGLQIWPSDSNFIYVRLRDRALAHIGATSQEEGLNKVCQRLLTRGTRIRHTGGGLRISIGTAAENQRTLANFLQVIGEKA
ncbi:aminotransferase class I/II-fold pyridoxal phosphate-dependent enzyme [cf. Phormidesmis sp. LEGE 11477]|uniref:aminotransferase class I/II-fold pyridoxal phosphate-dependent enzyme n=1 Tax=cf. Phormidesmis sp. LEGE 11477 TaxID=1828680 RepID=UPI00187E0AA4|nr:aminotransferase class I/II-fold pyridoxal phosphate-dependent enzyme [cf. Phormidesmis sp. LEGE 11477]MBE9061873.1 aminotransferase class I/II-fold pyridoxal phosphate-dependent enzyme [cf. Phormidesmis sp. LEGE 11477]